MNSYDFEYYRPKTVKEACSLFQTLKDEGKIPVYFCGGTEIITFGRLNLFPLDAVIDIKGIPECQVNEMNEQYLILGAAVSLSNIEEDIKFPLLSKTVREIADHTARNKITLGGNINANIFYREAVLPLLLTDSLLNIASIDGIKTVPIHEIFDEILQLKNDEFLLQVKVDQHFLHLPFRSIKKHKQWNTGYPLITVAAIKVGTEIRFAFSGLCPFPFRSKEMEQELNRQNTPYNERVKQAIQYIPEPILDDILGSKEYRLFVLKNTLYDILVELEGERHA